MSAASRRCAAATRTIAARLEANAKRGFIAETLEALRRSQAELDAARLEAANDEARRVAAEARRVANECSDDGGHDFYTVCIHCRREVHSCY